MDAPLKSNLCTQAQLETATFRRWSERLGVAHGLHRKLWEHCFIAQALEERGMLAPGRRGLGFGVGKEPLAALFASRGCAIVATDLDEGQAQETGWLDSGQHAANLAALNEAGLCDEAAFRRLVSFRFADMNAIAADLRGFDFTWSACSFEHVGSIALGEEFLVNQMDCLKPGGVAVHTTEFNVRSDDATLTEGPTVLFRRRDIERMAAGCAALGHEIALDLHPGDGLADGTIDAPPYTHNPHLKIQLAGYVTTSIGLIVRKPSSSKWTHRPAIRGLVGALPPPRPLRAGVIDEAPTLRAQEAAKEGIEQVAPAQPEPPAIGDRADAVAQAGDPPGDACCGVGVVAHRHGRLDDGLVPPGERRLAGRSQAVHDVAATTAARGVVGPDRPFQLGRKRRVSGGDRTQGRDGGRPGLRRVVQGPPCPEAIQGAAGLRADVAVRDRRLGAGILDQLGIGPAMPERQGQGPHERPVAVGALLRRPGLRGGDPVAQRPDRAGRLDADVEDAGIDGQFPPVVPGQEATAQIIEVQPAAIQERSQ